MCANVHLVLYLVPGKSHGYRNLSDYSPRGHKESDTTEGLHFGFLCLVSDALPLRLELGILNLQCSQFLWFLYLLKGFWSKLPKYSFSLCHPMKNR